MQEYNGTIAKRTIVELDLVGYSDIARYLEEHLGANAVMQLNKQIQNFVDEGLLSVNIARSEAVNSKAGDNAIVVFEHVLEAHRFAEAFHRITEQYNTGKTEASAERHFRLGISTGNIAIEGDDIAGTTIINSCRLEAGGDKGHILICEDTYEELPTEYRNSYVGPEILKDKRGKEHQVYRYVVVEEGKNIGHTNRISHISETIRNKDAYKWLSTNVFAKNTPSLATYSTLAVVLLIGLFYLTEPMRNKSAINACTTEFLNGIKSGDYKSSYSQLSLSSRQNYTLTDFISDHSSSRPKVQDFTIVQLTINKLDKKKAFAKISGSSRLYGRKTVDLELNKNEGTWKIVLNRNFVTTENSPSSLKSKSVGGNIKNFINTMFK